MLDRSEDATSLKVVEIQKTKSASLRNQFIGKWKGKVLESIKWHGRKFNRDFTMSDEEYSVALRALNEAIDSFDQTKNASFETFANQVISRRLINHFKEQQRFDKKFIPLDKEKMDLILDRRSDESEREKELQALRREELTELAKLLSGYGYSWIDVQKCRPKHQDSLKRLVDIALHIVHAGLGQRFLDEQPCSKELEKLIGLGIKRRFLKEYRPYLVSIILTFLHHFPIMEDYLLLYRKEGERIDASKRGSL